MTTKAAFPMSAMERAALGPDLFRTQASWDEYWSLLGACAYRVEYQNGEIISMSYENDKHSVLTSRFDFLFQLYFTGAQFFPFNANRPLYIEACEAVFNPDASVVIAPRSLYEYQKGLNAETTPLVVVEVLSPSTRERDWTEKLPCYKQIPTLNTIIYAESDLPLLYCFQRMDNGVWEGSILDSPEHTFPLHGQLVSIGEVYHRAL
jgi:Uma2 family endonuclease